MSNCKFHTNQFHGECCVCGASVSDIISTLQVRNETLEKAAKDVVDTMRGSGGINPKAAEALLNLAALLEGE